MEHVTFAAPRRAAGPTEQPLDRGSLCSIRDNIPIMEITRPGVNRMPDVTRSVYGPIHRSAPDGRLRKRRHAGAGWAFPDGRSARAVAHSFRGAYIGLRLERLRRFSCVPLRTTRPGGPPAGCTCTTAIRVSH